MKKEIVKLLGETEKIKYPIVKENANTKDCIGDCRNCKIHCIFDKGPIEDIIIDGVRHYYTTKEIEINRLLGRIDRIENYCSADLPNVLAKHHMELIKKAWQNICYFEERGIEYGYCQYPPNTPISHK